MGNALGCTGLSERLAAAARDGDAAEVRRLLEATWGSPAAPPSLPRLERATRPRAGLERERGSPPGQAPSPERRVSLSVSLPRAVHSHVDIYNFSDNTWGGRFDMAKDMAHSHLGIVTDGRFIYVVTGQYGPQCRGPTARNFVLDTETKEWNDLPPLPVPRACVVANDKLLVIGGQEGDFMANPGSPIFKCVRRSEVVYSNVYMLDDGTTWKELPPMPKPDSHIEFAWVNVNNSLVITGGTTDKHPITKKMVLVGEIFRFNLDMLEWSVIGLLPFRIKTTLVAYWDGWLYFTKDRMTRLLKRLLGACGELNCICDFLKKN